MLGFQLCLTIAMAVAVQDAPVPATSSAKAEGPVVPATLSTGPVASQQDQAVLAAGTPIVVAMDQALTTKESAVGDSFQVTVVDDVVVGTTVVIPKGTIGHGVVTFAAKRGGFGKGGILGIALRDLILGDRTVALDGVYREAGKSRAGATAATYFMVGIFAAAVVGDSSTIPKGRELKARTGEDIAYTPGAPPPQVPVKTVEATSTAPPAATGSAPSAGASAHPQPKNPESTGTITKKDQK